MMVRFGFQPCFSSSPSARASSSSGLRAGQRIVGAVDPGVVMIAANDPLVGKLRAGNARDDVVERLAIPVEADSFRCAFAGLGPDVIGERQPPRQASGTIWPPSAFSNGCRVGIGDRQHRNLRDGLHLIERECA